MSSHLLPRVTATASCPPCRSFEPCEMLLPWHQTLHCISYIIHSIQSVKKDYITKAAVCCCPHSNVVGIPQDLIADQRSDLNPASDHKGAMHISLSLSLHLTPQTS